MKRKLLVALLTLIVCLCLVLASCGTSKKNDKETERTRSSSTLNSNEDTTNTSSAADTSGTTESSDTNEPSDTSDSSNTTDVSSGMTDSSGDTTDVSSGTTDSSGGTNDSEQAPCEHNGGEATCEKLAECEACGEEYGDFADHTEETILGKAPTCTETGLADGKKCAVCGEVLLAQEEIAATLHNYVEGYCTVCGSRTPSVGLEYTLSDDETYYIVSGVGTCTDTDIVIPSEYNGKPVTGIGDYAFEGCTGLTRVVIGDNVTSIGFSAFERCTDLTSVIIPNQVTFIGSYALACIKLVEVYNLSALDISKGSAYYNYLGLNALNVYTSLEEESKQFVTEDGFLFYDNGEERYLLGYTGKEMDIVLPDSCNGYGYEIYTDAFFGCTSLTSVVIGDGVTSIGSEAFWLCSNLTSIAIPDSVTNIGYDAFYGCNSLTSVKISDIASWCNISFSGSYANPMRKGAGLYLNGELVTKLNIPDTVTSIKEYAFYNGTSLTNVVIPDSVTSIGDYAFYECESLTNVVIGENVMSIGQYAFCDCDSLTSVIIPNNVMSIDLWAFSECDSLTSVVIGENVTNIGEQAFSGCYKLAEVYNLSELNVTKGSIDNGFVGYYALNVYTSLDTESKRFTTEDGFVFVDDGKTIYLIGYEGTETDIVFPDNCNGHDYEIGKYAFYDCTSLTSVIIPNGVVGVGYASFCGCTSLTRVAIENGVSSIGDYAFAACESLTIMEIPDSVINIGESAFSSCTGLERVVLPNNLTIIALHAFKGCTSLKDLDIPTSVTCIGYGAFVGCESLTSVVIPNSVNSIEKWAFSDCISLTSVTIPNSVTIISSYAFAYCKKLTIYCEATSKPNGWSNIWNYSSCPVVWGNIKGSEGLEFELSRDGTYYIVIGIGECKDTDIVIPGTYEGLPVKEIGHEAFLGLNLTSVVIPNNVTSLSSYAFWCCENLTSVVIGEGVTSIGNFAFSGCHKLVEVYNLSELNITKGSVENGDLGYCALNVYTPSSGEKKTFITEDGFSFYDDGELRYLIGYVGKETDIVLPDSCNGYSYCIYEYAFYKSNILKSVVIPNNVTSIGDSAFGSCDMLMIVVIGESVTSIGGYAFSDCRKLAEVYNLSDLNITKGSSSYGDAGFYALNVYTSLEEESKQFITEDGFIFYDDGKARYLTGYIGKETDIVLPDSCNGYSYVINLMAFCGDNLTSVVIGDGVKRIDSYAFGFCRSLTSVVIGESVISIGNHAFAYCDNLTIYCEAKSQPSMWHDSWNPNSCPVVWGYTTEE